MSTTKTVGGNYSIIDKVIYKSGNIDLSITNTKTNLFKTLNNSGNFIITSVYIVVVKLDGISTSPQISIIQRNSTGTNVILSSFTLTVTAEEHTQCITTIPTTTKNVTPETNVQLDITSGATIPFIVNIYTEGFYENSNNKIN